MKNKRLYDAITDISDKNIIDAKKYRFKKRRALWIPAVACLLVAVICLPMFLGDDPVSGKKRDALTVLTSGFNLVASAAKPEGMYNTLNALPPELNGFVKKSSTQIGSSSDENVLYSPIGAYLNLAMLAECTGGDSRAQILDALGADSIESNRQKANTVYRNVYSDLDIPPASSLWIPDNKTYKQKALDALSKNYYTSVFEGKYSDPDTLEGMKKWMNDNTDGGVSDLVDGFELIPNSEMLLLNTLSYQGKWEKAFPKAGTYTSYFYAPGGETNAEYMGTTEEFRYKECDGFTALALDCSDGGSMVFMLPDYLSDIDTMLETDECAAAFADSRFCNERYKVSTAIPKFDLTQTIELIDTAKSLGITNIFSDSSNNFSSLSDDMNGDYIGRFSQMITVSIDEDGAKAASVTVSEGTYKSDSPSSDLKTFCANRPFVFVIFSASGLPLFSGVINNPTA